MKKLINQCWTFLMAMLMILTVSPAALAATTQGPFGMIEQEYTGVMPMMEVKIDELEAKGIQITRLKDSTLVSNIKNSSNGVISFDIKIPARQTLYYAVELIPNDRTGSIDTAKNASFTNSSNALVTRTISVNVKYFSDKYTITANYTTGNDRVKTIYECKKQATSKLNTTVYSTKFIWDSANVAKWSAGKAVESGVVIGLNKIAFHASKIPVPQVQGACTVFVLFLDLGLAHAAAQPPRTTQIMYEAKPGWGYQLKFVPVSGGYRTYLLTLNASGGVVQTDDLGLMYTAGINYVLK